MTKVKALISFSAYGIHARTGQELTIEDKGKRLDLEKLGWIERLEYETSEVSEDLEVKEVKKTQAKKESKQ
jgi:hypothetical protein